MLLPTPVSQTQDDMTNDHSTANPAWLTRGIILLLGLVAANLLAWRSIEPDLWGHIQYGEDWMHAGEMPTTATHTFSTPDQPWVNHENLFELAVALGQRTIGGLGLMIFKCVAGLWLLWTMVRVAQLRGVEKLAAVVAMIPVAYTIGTAISFINMTSNVVSIAITTDTMYLSSAGTTGTRSLAQYGSATAIKMTSTTWLISGSGLT